MGLLTTEAIVLGGMRLGEADKLVTFFSLKRGKVKGVAKGARRIKSRFGASLEPFTHCHLILFEKTGDKLGRINQVDIIRSHHSLREDWTGIDLASRMVNLVSQITPELEPNADIFTLLLQALKLLQIGEDPNLTTLLFINHLVIYSGYQPHWDNCLKCRQVFRAGSSSPVYFSSGAGGAVCSKCARRSSSLVSISHGTRAFLSTSQKMNYIRSHRLKPSPVMKQEMGAIFKDYISTITGSSKHQHS
jgi:DNA repair protein RecO (recombination protein O)